MRAFAIVGALALTGAANAVVIYDTMTGHTGGWTSTGSTPRHLMGDGFTIVDPGTSQWDVTKIETILYVSTAGSYNLSANFTIWNNWNSAGYGDTTPKPVFQNAAGSGTINIGTINPTGVAAYVITLNLPTPVRLSNWSNIGLQIDWLNNGVASDVFATGLWDVDPGTIVSGTSSTNAFYRDSNANGYLDTADARSIGGWVNTNAAYRITANAVPEPATIGALAIGLLAVIRRKRR